MAEAEYESLAALRQAIRSDDRGQFLDAADTVRSAGLSIDEVESDDPPVDELVDAGVIPAKSKETPAADHREQMIELLKQIEANTGGSA